MLGPDDLAEAEGWADWIRGQAGVERDEAISTRAIARRCLKTQLRKAELLRSEAELVVLRGQSYIFAHTRLAPAREEFAIGHELGHWARPARPRSTYEEAMCDAIGAALVAPREVVRRIVRHAGDRVHEIARVLRTEQALALLRIGEVTGRPVLLLRPEPTPRGDLFEWTREPLRLPRSVAHPIRVDRRWGMMAA